MRLTHNHIDNREKLGMISAIQRGRGATVHLYQIGWCLCKLRQARRENEEGRNDTAADHRREAEVIMARNGWREEDLGGEYPQVDN